MPEQLVENVIVVVVGVVGLALIGRAVLWFVYAHLPSFPEDDGKTM